MCEHDDEPLKGFACYCEYDCTCKDGVCKPTPKTFNMEEHLDKRIAPVCRHCKRVLEQHVDGHCLFDTTIWKAMTLREYRAFLDTTAYL